MNSQTLLIIQLLIGALFISVLVRYAITQTMHNNSSLHSILIPKLYDASPHIYIIGFLAASISTFGLWNDLAHSSLSLWLFSVTLITIAQLLLLYIWKHHPKLFEHRKWGEIYCFGSFLSGGIYGSIVYFYNSSLPYAANSLILAITIGTPMVVMPTHSIYLPAFYAFSLPYLLTMFYWVPMQSEGYELTMIGLCMAYISALYVISSYYNKNLCNSLVLQQANNKLITDLSNANTQLQNVLSLDPLTGLSNRQKFRSTAESMFQQAIDDNMNLALLRIDLDDLKVANDILGQEGGDHLLISVANRLSSNLITKEYTSLCRDAETSRYGGDEFLALLSGSFTQYELIEICRRTIHNLTQPVSLDEKTVIPSLSIGVAFSNPGIGSIDTLLRKSDHALTNIKSNGKNNFLIHRIEEEAITTA